DIQLLESILHDLKTCISETEAIDKVFVPRLKELEKKDSEDPKKEKKFKAEQVLRLIELHRVPRFGDIYRRIAQYSSVDVIPARRTAFSNVYSQIVSTPTTGVSSVPINWKAVRLLREAYLAAFEEKNKGVRGW